MDEMKRAMKYSLIFGICGAVLIPVIYEIYANVSRNGALVLFEAYVIFAGVKFSSLHAKEAMLGITTTAAYSLVLALPCFFVIHPRIKSYLERHSKYFNLEFREQTGFIVSIILAFLLMYLVWALRAGVSRAVKKLRSNSEKAGSCIDNAFDDKGEEQ